MVRATRSISHQRERWWKAQNMTILKRSVYVGRAEHVECGVVM
jgi:hypothetical protein